MGSGDNDGGRDDGSRGDDTSAVLAALSVEEFDVPGQQSFY
jgi:hypothetical protein